MYFIYYVVELILLFQGVHSTIDFNRSHTGAVLSVYVKRWNLQDGTIPTWKNYTMDDIKYMLNLTCSKFTELTTHSMGVGRVNESWNTGDVAGLVPVAAAQINAEYNELKISLVPGAWHSLTEPLRNKEIANAFEAIELANSIFPKTVWGVTLSSFTWMDYYRSWRDTVTYLKEYRPQANSKGLKLGLRLDICDQIKSRTVPEVGIDDLSPSIPEINGMPLTPDGQGIVETDIQMIARHADFLICILFPLPNTVTSGTQPAVTALGKRMLELEKAFKRRNPKLRVLWETGWPSAGVSRFGSVNTVRNLQSFWKEMGVWAKKNNQLVYMYTALDEPWRTNPKSDKEKTDPEGPNGADSNFGWWSLKDNENIRSFEEKVPEPEPVQSGNSWILFVIFGFVTLVVVIIILFWRLHKARQTIERLTEEDMKDFFDGVPKSKANGDEDAVENALNVPYDQSYELAADSIVIDELELLGKGQFGTVYKGRIKGVPGSVAFKKPNSGISVSQLKNLLVEIKIMIYIGEHENVVKLIGAQTKGIADGQLYVATECCGMGSLEHHLRSIPKTFVVVENDSGTPVEMNNEELEVRYVNHVTHYSTPKKISLPSLLRWSYEIANGMVYLGMKKIVHADLAARNILLTSEGQAKISDFGLSRRLYEYTQYVKSSQEPLPWRWMAIESLKNLSFSTQSDVWAYGITLWEIFTLGDVPYPGLSWNIDFVDKLEEGLRVTMPKYATPEIYNEMVKCWSPDPQRRPTFKELREYFEIAYEGGKLEELT